MKVQTALLSLTMAIAAGATPAAAADWGSSRESYQNMGQPAAVPVPAPIPVPDYRPSWYFRFDAGLGVISDPDVGIQYNDVHLAPGSVDGPDPFSANSSWFDTDFNTFLTYGGGVGYYFGNGFRIDATIEKRSKDDVGADAAPNDPAITGAVYDYDAAGNYVVVDGNLNGTADFGARAYWSEQTKVDGTIWMANLYYDFLPPGRGFTPYVGGGVGFVWNRISRSMSGQYDICDNEDLINGCTANNYSTVSTFSASDKSDTVSFAAAVMAGISYDVNEITTVDVGYRYLFLAGTDHATSVDINGQPAETVLEIGDQHIHQVRAGLRFNVN